MKVHLTGGSGFTGGFVLAELRARGHEVHALARSDETAERLRLAGAVPVRANLDDGVDALAAAFADGGCEALVNVASLGFGHGDAIVEAARRAGLARAVFVSTTAVFTALDASSKAVRTAAERTITDSGLAWTIVRPTMIYGTPEDRNLWRLLQFIARAPAVPLPDGGRTLQQPVHVADLAATIVAALDAPAAVGRAYDVPGPEPLAFRAMVEDACRAVGRFPRLVPVPARPVGRSLGLAEGRGLQAPISAEQVARLLEDKVFDGAAAARDLGHHPRPFWLGIAQEADLGRGQLEPGPSGRVGRLARTAAKLEPAQVLHRGRLRANRKLLQRLPDPLERRWRLPAGATFGWPARFQPLDAAHAGLGLDAGRLAEGVFTFLGVEHALGAPADWQPEDLPQLWRYHLHYFEWAWALHRHSDRPWAREAFASVWRSWQAGTRYGEWDAWSPYVAALRAWSLCGVFDGLVRGTDIEDDVVASLRAHAGYLRRNLELDVGGNHLVKDLKALLGLGCFFADDDLVEEASQHLARQLGIQVLADGGHYERSPAYHCQVLADLLDIERLLASAGRPFVAGMSPAIAAMQRWLGAMVLPDGGLPSFNDSQPVPPARLAALGPVVPDERLTVLADSGYVVARPTGRTALVVDVGDPCPPNLPAHAHSDCLSFELVVEGRRAIVNAGTSTYAVGPQRRFERSTAAHNTLAVDGTDQTEVWGQFRAGRRAHGTLESATDDGERLTVVGSHDGYRVLAGSPHHRRTLVLDAGGLEVVDEVEGTGTHLVTGRLRWLADGPALDVRVEAEGAVEGRQPTEVAADFGAWRRATGLVVRAKADLPLRWRTSVSW